jgi:hypothetical protein
MQMLKNPIKKDKKYPLFYTKKTEIYPQKVEMLILTVAKNAEKIPA